MGNRLPRGFWLNVMLLLAVVGSSLSVVWVSHKQRELIAKIHQQSKTQNELQVEWGKLLLERSTVGSLAEVDEAATIKLGMVSPAPDKINVVRLP